MYLGRKSPPRGGMGDVEPGRSPLGLRIGGLPRVDRHQVFPRKYRRGFQLRGADVALPARCPKPGEEKVILIGLSGHGHFDISAYADYLAGRLAHTASL